MIESKKKKVVPLKKVAKKLPSLNEFRNGIKVKRIPLSQMILEERKNQR